MSKENIVCLCKHINEETIVNVIKQGATSIEEVREKTGATGGQCRGGRCKGKIEALINEYK